MAKKLDGDKNLCERELLEKILGIVEKQLQLPLPSEAGGCCLYDNKSLMEKLHIKEKYLKSCVTTVISVIRAKVTNTGIHRKT